MMDIPASHNISFLVMDAYNGFQQQQQPIAVSPQSVSSSGSSPISPPLSSLSISPQEGGGFLNAPPFIERRQKNVSNFINKLYNIVNDDSRYAHLIAWGPNGTSFVITSARLFAQNVLPEYFKHDNFASFVRQLNMYGFRKVNKSPRGKRGTDEDEIWEFQHPQFRRDRRDLLPEIKRKSVDSDALRRETGDMQSTFAAMQAAQAQMQQKFQVLQQNFSNLLQGFEELKRNQMQIQIGIRKLLQYQQGVHQNQQPNLTPTAAAADTSGAGGGNPQVFITTPDILQQAQSRHDFDAAVNTPLPPSPVPNEYYSPTAASPSMYHSQPVEHIMQQQPQPFKVEQLPEDTYSDNLHYTFQQ